MDRACWGVVQEGKRGVRPRFLYIALHGMATHTRQTWPRVPGVARHVVRQHQHNVAVGDAQALHQAVEGQGIGHVPVVEPEARGADLGLDGGEGW